MRRESRLNKPSAWPERGGRVLRDKRDSSPSTLHRKRSRVAKPIPHAAGERRKRPPPDLEKVTGFCLRRPCRLQTNWLRVLENACTP
jgi:hypothetical protein